MIIKQKKGKVFTGDGLEGHLLVVPVFWCLALCLAWHLTRCKHPDQDPERLWSYRIYCYYHHMNIPKNNNHNTSIYKARWTATIINYRSIINHSLYYDRDCGQLPERPHRSCARPIPVKRGWQTPSSAASDCLIFEKQIHVADQISSNFSMFIFQRLKDWDRKCIGIANSNGFQ